jgi:penicillin-binding protein 2
MRWIKFRQNQIQLLIFILMLVLVSRLFTLTVVEGTHWDEAAQAISIKSVYTSAPRGEILDRYGRLLAGNRPSFTVQFSQGNLDDETLNNQVATVMSILDKNGDTVNDNLPIILENDGTFYYTHEKAI